ncbi:DgyrCDS1271 [Dimorphilus gyrociliatus]|uniref:DgyrCDS1271 n=1 Tax=Dimorphilus gyrociliatus TaxID=2664684 RepID=A0A7I8VBV7_9ANNE|nr:DgyrCDS1271 [Dimorphilus gyrociliatus]
MLRLIQLLVISFLFIHYVQSEKLLPKSSHVIIAPKYVRPDMTYRMSVAIFDLQTTSAILTATIANENFNEAIASSTIRVGAHSLNMLEIKVPNSAPPGNYSLKIQALTSYSYSSILFENKTELFFKAKQVSIFLQTDKAIYGRLQYINFRILAVKPNLQPVSNGQITIYLLNPRGVRVHWWKEKMLQNGLFEGKHFLTDPRLYGWWQFEILAFGETYFKKFYSFEYYQGMLEVNVTMPHYVMENEYGIVGLVTANWTKGYPIKGSGHIQYELNPPENMKNRKSISFQTRIPFFEGVTSFAVGMDELRNMNNNASLEGYNLVATAVVHDIIKTQLPATGQATTKIFGTGSKLRVLGGRIRTFKPGKLFDLYIAVYQADGQPYRKSINSALRIERQVSKLDGSPVKSANFKDIVIIGDNGIAHLSFIPEDDDDEMTITIAHRQAGIKVVATREFSAINEYLYVTTSTVQPKVGAYMIFTVRCTTYVPKIQYMVTAQGTILFVNELAMESQQKTFSIALSRDMIPRAHILVYGLYNGRVLADALHFYVDGVRASESDLKLVVNKGKDFTHNTIEVVAKGDPSTLIAFNVQDYSIYRYEPNFLTRDKIEKEFASYDLGANSTLSHTWLKDEGIEETVHFPAPSSAIDSNTTFLYLGLEIFTDAKLDRIPGRATCNFTLGFSPCFVSGCYSLDKACDGSWDCADGADEMGCPSEDDYTPKRPQNIESLYPVLIYNYEETSWLWSWHYTKPDGSSFEVVKVPYRPTTWLVSALTLSKEHGLAIVENPVRFKSTRPFYIEMDAPEIVRTGEQIGLQVTVFNYWSETLEILVTIHDPEPFKVITVPDDGYVTNYDPVLTKGSRQVMVWLKPGGVTLIHFGIVSAEIGEYTVSVSGESFAAKHTQSATIKVVAYGVENYYNTPRMIDMLNSGALSIPDLEIPINQRFLLPEKVRHLYVPGSPHARVSVVGGSAGPSFTYGIWDTSTYLRTTTNAGSVFANNLGINLLWLNFFRTQKAVNKETIKEVHHGIADQVAQLMVYYTNMGNGLGYFSMWTTERPSLLVSINSASILATFYKNPEWLQQELYIDIGVVQNTTMWICNRQLPNGAFGDDDVLFDMTLYKDIEDSNGKRLNVSYTAYAIVMLQDIYSHLTNSTVAANLRNTLNLATKYIAPYANGTDDPFIMAHIALALKKASHYSSEDAFKKFYNLPRKDNGKYWSRVPIKAASIKLENQVPVLLPKIPQAEETQAIVATSIGLILEMMRFGTERDLSIYIPIVNWLQTMRTTFYGWSSPIASYWALQALIAYEKADKFVAIHNIFTQITQTSTDNVFDFYLNKTNWYDLQAFEINDKVWGTIRTGATGSGIILLQQEATVTVEYQDQIRQSLNRTFELDVDSVSFYGRNYSILEVTVCAKWLRTDLSPTSGQADIEIQIPSGYYVLKEMLNNFTNSNPLVQDNGFDTSTQVAVYELDYIPPERTCVFVQAHRYFPVANITIQQTVRVYDHYDIGKYNKTYYEASTLFQTTICQVFGSYQCPYSPFYNSAKPLKNTPYISLFSFFIIAFTYKWIFR